MQGPRSKLGRHSSRGLALALALAAPASFAADAEAGRAISIKHCARCHVVGDHNPFGGIGSTPSFQSMKFLDDYLDRFRTFYSRRPHPVFTRMPGLERWSDAPPNAPEFTITVEEIEDIVAFVETLKRPGE